MNHDKLINSHNKSANAFIIPIIKDWLFSLEIISINSVVCPFGRLNNKEVIINLYKLMFNHVHEFKKSRKIVKQG